MPPPCPRGRRRSSAFAAAAAGGCSLCRMEAGTTGRSR
uniref:Uncharacterized protein n=1 Tax=Arundo donax TaxID=35708 RepID=A0A0A9HHS6_ARUDO